MKLSTALAFLCLLGSAVAALNPEGTKCGEKRCSTVEYCSPYDKHCKPCSNICDATGRNYQPNECVSDCQEYLHDKRYVLLKQYEDLKGEIGRLWILAAASIAIAFFSLLSTFYLVARKFPRWEKMRNAVSRTFTGRRLRRTSHGNATSKSNNHNNNNNNKSTQQDAELGTSKQNGLKIPMPTISATVAPSRCAEKDAGHGNGNCSASGSGSGSGIGISTVSGSGSGLGNATPNTTSTTLSRRHPSEDTTLDYAYDNPAMTPSPESVQLRTKRESSF